MFRYGKEVKGCATRHNQNMKDSIGRTLLASFLLLSAQGLSCESKPQDAVDSHRSSPTDVASEKTPRTEDKTPPSPKYSPHIKKLFLRAQSGMSVPIRDIPIPFSNGPTQGRDGPSPDGRFWDISHNYGKPTVYDDAIVAHELFHTVLMNRGFFNANHIREGQIVPSIKPLVDATAALNLIVHLIGPDCFPDELIDQEMKKEGFKPQLLVEDEMRQMENGASRFNPDREEMLDQVRAAYALQVFSVGKRISDRSMLGFEKRIEGKWGSDVGPDIIARERKLSKQFRGQRCVTSAIRKVVSD